jgi:hypothetical protein
MPFIRSSASKYLAYHSKLVAVILLLSEIIPSYSHYAEKGLVYIIITALFNRQPFSYSKCTKLNIYLSCNVYSISNTKCIYLIAHLYTF